MKIDAAITGRRTHKRYAGGSISRADLEAVIDVATWAPTHRYTEPWRFYVVHGTEKLAEMNGHVQAALDTAIAGAEDTNPMGARKMRTKKTQIAERLANTAAVVVVTWQRSPSDLSLDREDYAAVACAIQNLLLSAHGRGYGSLWSTGKILMRPSLRAFYGIAAPAASSPVAMGQEEETIAGVIFLGTPVDTLVGRRQRSAASVTTWC